MALTWNGYASLVEANNYFEQKFHTFAWNKASADDKVRANNDAFQGINMFNYISQKYPVQQLLNANPDTPEADLQAADLTQVGEFPRGDSTVVPKEIEYAQFLWAYALLDGRVPEEDFEQLAVTSQAYGGVRQAYNRQIAMTHTALLIPSSQAYNYLRPWFRNDWGFCLIKV